MNYSHDGFTASIHHNWERERDFWVYTIRKKESGELLYQGFSKSVSEAVETVESRMRALETRKEPEHPV